MATRSRADREGEIQSCNTHSRSTEGNDGGAIAEIAAGIEHEAVKGYTQLNKEHLLTAICTALNIDTHTRHKSKVAGRTKARSKRT
jgi:hypothetical protein